MGELQIEISVAFAQKIENQQVVGESIPQVPGLSSLPFDPGLKSNFAPQPKGTFQMVEKWVLSTS